MPTLLVAAGEATLPSLVLDIGLALVGAGVLAVVFAKLRIPTIAAFLLAGVLLGPVFGLIEDEADIDTIAQLGLILLLFLIGLEINVKALAQGGRTVILSGLLQFPLTVIFGLLAAQGLLLLGVGSGVLEGNYAALYVGIAIGASSTLLVVAMLQRSFTLDTVSGRMALALLVFQDIWAIVVLALQPNLDSPEVGPIAASLGGILLLGVLAAAVARTILRSGFSWVAKQPATILVAALAWCFVVVIAGINIDEVFDRVFGVVPGMTVSAGMGALIAGTTIATLPFATEIARQVSVVRDFFVTLFFVGIGMTIPAPDEAGIIIVALILAALAIFSRFVVMLPLLYLSGFDRRNATLTSTKLAQISEFGLVIAFLGLQLGHIDQDVSAVVVFAFVLTAVVSPWMFSRADAMYQFLSPVLDRLRLKHPVSGSDESAESYDLALLGLHRTGSSLLAELNATAPELLERTLVVDFNVAIHDRIAALGPHVVYGDFTIPETLQHAGVDRARVVMCTIPGDVLVSATPVGLVETVRALCPDSIVIFTAISSSEARALYAAGADYVLMPRHDGAHAAFAAIRTALNGEIESLREQAAGHMDDRGGREVLD
ncbi:MAG TPA: cation:proton antiporter [Acidimicrobiia bacterium]|nr:cation:proton antiporter [Acidimicrobiia bacterium]